MGRPKAHLPFRGGTFLSVLRDAFTPFCDPIVAVFGFDGERLAAQAPAGIQTTQNSNYQRGMLTSLQAGLRALSDYDQVLFTLVDHPAVCPDTVARLVAAEACIAIPRYAGKRGHPVKLRREIALEYLTEPIGAKARDVIDRHAAEIRYLDVDDPGTREDVDSPDIYEALLAREGART
jgi:CTP:molybdopterin cytidylyltransferase MocA